MGGDQDVGGSGRLLGGRQEGTPPERAVLAGGRIAERTGGGGAAVIVAGGQAPDAAEVDVVALGRQRVVEGQLDPAVRGAAQLQALERSRAAALPAVQVDPRRVELDAVGLVGRGGGNGSGDHAHASRGQVGVVDRRPAVLLGPRR